jgi:glycine cleavage system H protein
MSADIPDRLLYTEEHEWIDPETGWVGITDHAQEELGDVVFVDLPSQDDTVSYMEPFMMVESVKAVSDIYSPADGTVREVNRAVVDEPERVNDDPYEDGRLARLEVESLPDDLMDSDAYRDHVG